MSHIDFAIPSASKEETAHIHRHLLLYIQLNSNQWIAHSDGSRLDNGQVGAGIYYHDEDNTEIALPTSLHLRRGQEVYDADLHGTCYGLETLAEMVFAGPHPRDIWFCVDNAAAIQRLQHLRKSSSQHHALQVHELARSL